MLRVRGRRRGSTARSRGVWVYRCQVRKNYDGQVVMSVFRCDRGGKPTNWRKLNETTRKQHRPSRRIGCPMRIRLVSMDFYDASGEWKIEYTPDGSALHNHPPDERRRQREATATIDLTGDDYESDGSSDNQSIDLSLDSATELSMTSENEAIQRRASTSNGHQSLELPGAGTEQPVQQSMPSMTSVPMYQPSRPVEEQQQHHQPYPFPPPPPSRQPPMSTHPPYQQPPGYIDPSVQTETFPSGWQERRQPQSQILAFRESIFYLFGTQPIPLHVVESVELKELVLACIQRCYRTYPRDARSTK